MNDRQKYALTHPINSASGAPDPNLKKIRKHPRGFLLMSILAVDR